MAETTETTEHGSNSWLAFIVGALIVGVLVMGYILFTEHGTSTVTSRHEFDFKVEAPKLPVPTLPEPAPAPSQRQ